MRNLLYRRRIAYQEATHTFGVISRRFEMQDPSTGKTYPTHLSASLTAGNITYSSAKSSDASMATSSKACDRSLMGETEFHSFLVLDQHTFEGKILCYYCSVILLLVFITVFPFLY